MNYIVTENLIEELVRLNMRLETAIYVRVMDSEDSYKFKKEYEARYKCELVKAVRKILSEYKEPLKISHRKEEKA